LPDMPPAGFANILFLSELRDEAEPGAALNDCRRADQTLRFQYRFADDMFSFCDQMAGNEIFQVKRCSDQTNRRSRMDTFDSLDRRHHLAGRGLDAELH